jgi:Flp pilus assembly CpaF family ATPase
MVNGLGPVWVERAGRLERAAVGFAAEADLRHAIERILASLGRRVDEAEPLCDARLPDGYRQGEAMRPHHTQRGSSSSRSRSSSGRGHGHNRRALHAR